MSLFIVGILVGWLAEWLFFTFWVSKEESKNDCSDLESVLQAKNIEISALKAEIKKATTVSETNSKATAVAKSSDGKTTSAEKKKETLATVKKAPKSAAKAESKSTDNKANPKSVAKKKATSAKKVKKSKFANGDDFTKLSGIGPSMTNMMHEIGITTYKKLADMDDDILRTMLEAAGARLNRNKEAMDSWNEQATLADKGDFAGLKKFQEELKNK